MIGLKHLKCIHANDSKPDFGSRHDRHEHIGKGFIGLEGFRTIVGFPKLKNLKATAGFLASSGFKPGIFWALVLGSTEFFGGLALLAGFASRIAAGFLIISMVVATLLKIFKWKVPFSKGNDAGWE